MNTHSSPRRFCHSPIPRRAAVLLVALAWSSLSFCGEIHDAAKSGDVEKVKTLLKGNPDSVSSKDEHNGATPLQEAAIRGRKDAVELLLANKADGMLGSHEGLTRMAGSWCATVVVKSARTGGQTGQIQQCERAPILCQGGATDKTAWTPRA
jgi:ankyrin repeat protein